MLSLKRSIIFSLLFLVFISTQNTLALTYLPESSYYSGNQYRGAPNDWVRIEFAVYNNGGAEFTQGTGGYELPSSFKDNPSDELSKFEYVYAYQIINEVTSLDLAVDFFSIYGIGQNAIGSAQDIGWVEDETGEPEDIAGQRPREEWLALKPSVENDENGEPIFEEDDDGKYFYSAHWEFDHEEFDDDGELIDNGGQILNNGKHSYFLLIGSDYDYMAGSYTLERPEGGSVPIPGGSEAFSGDSSGGAAISNPEPCSLVLFGLGSILLSKRQRKK